ncbi:hypothetical protein H2248_001621 [Termitomyces sp. 'cryptogamus']|nr:hypothetical protein H2248_001621 [Termitomyces sp. 'cryptogamus']
MKALTPPLEKQLQELHLITSSLLPGNERLTFLDEEDIWNCLIMQYADPTTDSIVAKKPEHPLRFRIDISASDVCFIVQVPIEYEGKLTTTAPTFAAKGDQITRTEQEKWQDMVEDHLKQIGDSEFPIYELLSLHLLPILHKELESHLRSVDHPTQQTSSQTQSMYHALLTSHHLISPNKRRSLQHWSASLSISGFAKVGYPGVIYASGWRDNVEEFVENVKAMQWLALKVRFVEELSGSEKSDEVDRRWFEFQKVGEVVEEMRRLGREKYIVEMGIGSKKNDLP